MLQDVKREESMEYTRKRSKFISILAVILVFALLLVNTSTAQVYGATAKPAKPAIKTLSSATAESFRVTTKKNSGVTGYQIKYSLKKNFSNSKKITVKGSKLNKTVKGLKGGKRYYVRIRAYKKTSGGKVYSKWSGWKSVKIAKQEGTKEEPAVRYMTSVTTNVYKKPDSSSAKITLWYNTKVTLISSVTSSSSGTWYKIKYRGKYYYLWDKTNNPKKITAVNAVKSADEYIAGCSTDIQKDILTKAFDIYTAWDTAYDFDSKYTKTIQKKNGKYLLHCSGFVSYVMNRTIQKDAPPFEVSSKPDELANTEYVLNEGLQGEIKGRTICSGELTAAKKNKLKPGDIVCFKLMENDKRKIDHVGIYIGNGQFIHSTRVSKGLYLDSGLDPDGGVCIAPLSGMYKNGFKKAIRILPDRIITADTEMTATTVSHVFSDKNCENVAESNALHAGDPVMVLYTYRTSSGKHNAYIAYGDNYEKKAYLYLYEGKLK